MVDPVGPTTDPQGAAAVTPDRDHLPATCPTADIGRRAGQRQRGMPPERHLPHPLLRVAADRRPVRPRGVDAQSRRRHPQLPNATPTHVVAELLTLAVVDPDHRLPSVRRPSRPSAATASSRPPCSKSCSSTHGLVRRSQRVAQAAAITAATSGLSIERTRAIEPFGFCHYSPAPGCLVAAGLLLHRQPQRHRHGVPAHRYR